MAPAYLYTMRRLLVFLSLLLALVLGSCQPDMRYESGDEVYRTGDDQRWATRPYDDSSWSIRRGNTGNRVFWVRNRVWFSQRDTTTPLGLQVRAFGAFEVYWDGTLIGRNGRPATATRPEKPGTETSGYLVPEALAKPGQHLVALRATQANAGDQQRFIQVKLHSYPRMLEDPMRALALVNLMAGALLVAALYYLFLFVNSRPKAYGVLVFSLIGFLCFCLLTLEFARYYLAIPYPYFYTRLTVIGLLTFAVAGLVPLYFSLQFNIHRRSVLISLHLALLLGVYVVNYPHYDLTAIRLSQAMGVTSLVIVLLAIRQGAKGGILVLAGLLASALTAHYLVFDFSLFISFTILVLCMLYLQTVRVGVIEDERRSAQLLSARLQLELVKKNIQPHFIKNTLTSMLDWVEESPRQGAIFIQALADEFEVLNEIAEATVIPVGRELALCRYHLRVMEFRKEVRYELVQTGVDLAELIPPAILHTVLENGITHSQPPADGRICFRLGFTRTRQYKRYTVLTCAEGWPGVAGPIIGKGTGMRYIEARLRESYGSDWAFNSHAVAEGWLTTITITRAL